MISPKKSQPPGTIEAPDGRRTGHSRAVFEAAYGYPTAEEAAAILGAVQVVLEGELVAVVEPPWAYRSMWRRAAIHEGMGTSIDLGGPGVS